MSPIRRRMPKKTQDSVRINEFTFTLLYTILILHNNIIYSLNTERP